jgi:hypothetical protein
MAFAKLDVNHSTGMLLTMDRFVNDQNRKKDAFLADVTKNPIEHFMFKLYSPSEEKSSLLMEKRESN